MKKVICGFAFVVIIASCSSPAIKKNESSCWNEKLSTQIYDQLLSVFRTMDSIDSQSKTYKEVQLVESSCNKRKYIYGDHMFVLVNHKDTIEAKSFHISDDPKKCLDRGLSLVNSLHSVVYQSLIERHREKYPMEWNDPDLSPVSWLQCGEKGLEFDESVTTMLHEMTHELRAKERQCLWLAVDQKELCFELPNILPLRSYGKIDHFPTFDPNAIRGLTALQKMYLTDTDQPLIMLLDELNAYTLTNKNYLDRYMKFGRMGIFKESDGKRYGIFVPVFYEYLMLYLSRLKKDDLKLYNNVFRANKTNNISIKELMSTSKKTYESWIRYLKTQHELPKDFENNLYKDALKIEASLKL